MTQAVTLAQLASSGALSSDASGNVGVGTPSPSVSGIEVSRATGVSPTPVELRLTTTTNDSGWSTSNPWGRLSFYSADASTGGAKIHASIQTVAQSSSGGNSNLDFFVTDTANGNLYRTLSFQGAGTNTTQTVFYSGGGTQAMTLDANAQLILSGSSSRYVIGNNGTSSAFTQFTNTGGNAYVGLDSSGGGLGGAYTLNLWHGGNYPIVFATNNTPRGRFTSDGAFCVNATAAVGSAVATIRGNRTLSLQGETATSTGDIYFNNPSGTQFWSIASNQSNWYLADADFTNFAFVGQNFTAWSFGSDSRLKENIVDIDYGLSAIMSIKPRRYVLKASGHQDIGFIAQELRSVVPEAVSGEEIEYEDDDTPQQRAQKSLGVSKETLIPVLVKAIQEQQAMIETLQAKVAALEAK